MLWPLFADFTSLCSAGSQLFMCNKQAKEACKRLFLLASSGRVASFQESNEAAKEARVVKTLEKPGKDEF